MLLSCGVKAVNPCDLKGKKIALQSAGIHGGSWRSSIASQSLI
jgi:hypothetical protein